MMMMMMMRKRIEVKVVGLVGRYELLYLISVCTVGQRVVPVPCTCTCTCTLHDSQHLHHEFGPKARGMRLSLPVGSFCITTHMFRPSGMLLNRVPSTLSSESRHVYVQSRYPIGTSVPTLDTYSVQVHTHASNRPQVPSYPLTLLSSAPHFVLSVLQFGTHSTLSCILHNYKQHRP